MARQNSVDALVEFENSGTLDVTQQLKLLGVAVSATAAEINALASASLSAAEAVQLGLITATAAEINNAVDASVSTETVTGAGAISVTTAYTSLVTTAADALTIAAPGAATAPRIKVIHMTTDGGDGTLASTNIVGQSSGTTSITFNDAGDYLVLAAIPGLNKWSVVKEGGVTAA